MIWTCRRTGAVRGSFMHRLYTPELALRAGRPFDRVPSCIPGRGANILLLARDGEMWWSGGHDFSHTSITLANGNAAGHARHGRRFQVLVFWKRKASWCNTHAAASSRSVHTPYGHF
jgi:hypothetical protein